MAEKIFQKGKADFKKILDEQKKGESDPKFAISNALQEYKDQVERTAGYKSFSKLDKAGIRQNVIDFVDNYSFSSLDSLKGMDFNDALTLQKTTEKQIDEFEGLYNQNILRKEELDYIKETVGRTNEELKNVLKIGTRLTLAFRDFKKELKPLKLAERVGLTKIPIIGRRIERAITAEEEAESSALSIKRALRKKEARIGRKEEDQLDDTLPGTESPRQVSKKTAQKAVQDLFAPTTKPASSLMSKEGMIEEERESDEQFKTSSGLLEDILEENKLTNELLQGKKGGKGLGKGDDGGGFSLLEYLGISSALKTGKGAISKLGNILKSPKTMGRMLMTGAKTALTAVLGVGGTALATIAAVAAPLAGVVYLAKKAGDEYIELMKRGQIRAEDSPQYHSQYVDPYGDESGAGYIPPVPEAPGTYDNTEYLKQLGQQPYTPAELKDLLEKEAGELALKAKQKTLANEQLNQMSLDETILPDTDMVTNKLNKASEISSTGIERTTSTNISGSYNNTVVNNQQNNNNSTNRQENSTPVTIGTDNPDSKSAILTFIP